MFRDGEFKRVLLAREMWVTVYLHLCHGAGRECMHLVWKETSRRGTVLAVYNQLYAL